jgi:hypothetical protein
LYDALDIVFENLRNKKKQEQINKIKEKEK